MTHNNHAFLIPHPQTRTSTDPEDVQQMAMHMAEKNRQAGQDLDRIFMQRKQRETETAQVPHRKHVATALNCVCGASLLLLISFDVRLTTVSEVCSYMYQIADE